MNHKKLLGKDMGRNLHWGLLILLIVSLFGLAMIPGLAAEEQPDAALAIPPWQQTAKLLSSDGATDDHYGWAVAASGDTVVVGMDHRAASNGAEGPGAAYVYERPSTGWTNSSAQTAKLSPLTGDTDSNFASAVAISGDTIVAGAPGFNGNTGAVYIYVRQSGIWPTFEVAKLTASDAAGDAYFGESVAISGDTIVVGASGVSGNTGAAYVFVRPSSGWTNATETTKLTASDGAATDLFGRSVAVSSDTIVVGAEGVADDGNDYVGQAYVFVRPNGGWASGGSPKTENAILTANQGEAFDEFGAAVAIDADTIVVGAPSAAGNNSNTDGKAYVFVKGNSWSSGKETEQLAASDGAAGDKFGHFVGISGDTIVVGAPSHEDTSEDGRGAVYIYVRSFVGWGAAPPDEAILTAGDAADGDELGFSVGISGGTVVAGAPGKANSTNSSQGAAYVLQGKFCSKTSGDWSSAGSWVGGEVPAETVDVCITTGDTVTLSENGFSRRLLVNPGAVMDLSGFELSVEDFVTNNGTMKQTKTVNPPALNVQEETAISEPVHFLWLQSQGTGTKYKGVEIASGNLVNGLGSVTVSIRETIDWFSPTAYYQYCTSTGASSPAYAQRCYDISLANPEMSETTRVGLYAPEDELNGINWNMLLGYHSDGLGTWTPFAEGTDGIIRNCNITINQPPKNPKYCYMEGEVDGFSPFLLGEADMVPTAVSFAGLNAGAIAPYFVLILVFVLATLTIAAIRRRQKQE